MTQDIAEIRKKISHLVSSINHHNDLFHNKATPEISDYEFDQLMAQLIQLEKDFPELALSNSPTKKVGSDVNKNFHQVAHLFPMLSLGNVYSKEELKDFYDRLCKLLGLGSLEMACELKLDGVAISLIYEGGKLARAVTRGNGLTGDDVTKNIFEIKSIPKAIPYAEECEIRGEVFMLVEEFERLNRIRVKSGEAPWANPRNTTAGTLKLLDSGVVAQRPLEFGPYTLVTLEESFPKTQEEALRILKKWGFKSFSHHQRCSTFDAVVDYINLWEERRGALPMCIDGVVIKVNNLSQQQELGSTSHSPRWAIAYKYKPESALTQLLAVTYQVGRTGAITPVADLVPVELSGTTVSRASLYNENYIQALSLHESDFVFVEKSGEIIPKIMAIDHRKRQKGSVPIVFPKDCPECSAPLQREEEDVMFYCKNDSCTPQLKAKIVHFVSKPAMNIASIGPRTIGVFFENGLVVQPSDLYKLTFDAIVNLEGFQKRSAETILREIENSKVVPFSRVLYAIGIRHVGEVMAEKLCEQFFSIDALMAASIDELSQADEVGIKIASSIKSFLANSKNIDHISELRNFGLQFSLGANLAKEKTSQIFADKVFVITGVFENYTREALKSKIKEYGGRVSDSISTKTNYLIAGSSPGSKKVAEFRSLGRMELSENDFIELFGGGLKL